ncbi:hypothetical protein OS187_02915 [Xanthomonadaceae bacterium JHOS43]|nr:hypothetical protein [Xanthomonadaceae bacterium JHOS43]MCX7563345.1 hypothetical protein [Xanthomonadaceae bacterium XH05]
MKLLIRALVFCRYIVLNRQAREIKRSIQSLPVTAQRAVGQLAMTEIENADRTPVPHLYGSSSTDIYQPWGDGATLAFDRARSRVPQLKLRGTALWLAIAYQETRESPHASMQTLHRDVLGMLGLLKGTYTGQAPTIANAAS